MVYLDHPKHVQPCPLDFPSGKTYVPTLCSCHLSPQSLTWLRLFSVWSEPLVLRCSAHLTSTFKTFSPDFLNDNFASSLNTNESILIWSKTFFGVSKLRRVKFLSFFLLCHHFRDFNEMRGRGLFVANTKNSVENTLNLGAGYMEVWNYPPVLCYPRDLYTLAVYTRDKKHSAYNLPGQHKQYWPNKAKQKIFFFRQTNSDMLRGLIYNCVNCFS